MSYLYILSASHSQLSRYFVGVSPWIIGIFCWATHGELSRCFIVVSLWVIWIFCCVTHGELSRYFIGVSLWVIWIFCWATHGYLLGYFVGRLTLSYFVGWLTVNYLDILSASHCELSGYFVGRLTVNYVDILPASQVNFLDIPSTIHGDISRYIVGCLSVNYMFISSNVSLNFLDTLWGDSRWIFSLRCRLSDGELYRYFLQHFKANCADILPVISLNALDVLSAIHGEFSHYDVGCVTVIYLFFCPSFHTECSRYVVGRFNSIQFKKSQLISSLRCRASGVELSRFFFRLLGVN